MSSEPEPRGDVVAWHVQKAVAMAVDGEHGLAEVQCFVANEIAQGHFSGDGLDIALQPSFFYGVPEGSPDYVEGLALVAAELKQKLRGIMEKACTTSQVEESSRGFVSYVQTPGRGEGRLGAVRSTAGSGVATDCKSSTGQIGRGVAQRLSDSCGDVTDEGMPEYRRWWRRW